MLIYARGRNCSSAYLPQHSSRAHNETAECASHCSSRVGKMDDCQTASEASNRNVIECGAVSPHATLRNRRTALVSLCPLLTCRHKIISCQTRGLASFIRLSFNYREQKAFDGLLSGNFFFLFLCFSVLFCSVSLTRSSSYTSLSLSLPPFPLCVFLLLFLPQQELFCCCTSQP